MSQGSGKVKNQGPVPGSGFDMNIPDHISKSLQTVFWVKFFYADPDPGFGIFLTLDPGSGMEKIRIRDTDPGSATLFVKHGVVSGFCSGLNPNPV